MSNNTNKNFRGQTQDFINKSVDIGEKRENTFKKNVELKTNKSIVKGGKYKQYDFKISGMKNIFIELKTYNYNIYDRESFMIGCDKIQYFNWRKSLNPTIRIFLIFGFYDLINKQLLYKYIEIIDFLKISKYHKFYYLDKKHYNIPTAEMLNIDGFFNILNDL